ncbi:hypothetical protein PINS_up020134 [Pythium insidiosum]|nr:hypothetical protein PINS_up020134 [Pythium insidiosum]
MASRSEISVSASLPPAVDAASHERDVLNLKMEVAHLRERLLLRVGGDTTAAELEAETFALKRALSETQEALAARQQELRALDGRFAKALRNVVKLDDAWKRSAREKQRAQDALGAAQRELAALKDQSKAQEERARETNTRLEALLASQDERRSALEAELAAREQKSDALEQELQRTVLRVKELESQVDATKRQLDAGGELRLERDDRKRQEDERRQREHQEALEQCATLRGETLALRDERSALQSQLSDTKASLSAAMAKLLQLKEEHATLEVRLAAALKNGEQRDTDVEFYKREVDRVQTELALRDDRLLQQERQRKALEQQLHDAKQALEASATKSEQDAQRLQRLAEQTWREREAEMQREMSELKSKLESSVSDVERLRQEQQEACEALVGPQRRSQDLLSVVRQVVEREAGANATTATLKRRVTLLEKQAVALARVTQENTTLKAEVEKTRKAMERMVGRRTKADAHHTTLAQFHAPTLKPQSTQQPRVTPTAVLKPMASVGGGANKENSVTPPTVGTKRRLELTSSGDNQTQAGEANGTPSKPVAKRVVYVQSRYLQPTATTKSRTSALLASKLSR